MGQPMLMVAATSATDDDSTGISSSRLPAKEKATDPSEKAEAV